MKIGKSLGANIGLELALSPQLLMLVPELQDLLRAPVRMTRKSHPTLLLKATQDQA